MKKINCLLATALLLSTTSFAQLGKRTDRQLEEDKNLSVNSQDPKSLNET